MDDETIGITRFCVHPSGWYQSKTRIGGTKDLHLDKIKALQPDFVIASKEENIREQVEEIRKFCPVWTSDVANLHDALEMIREISRLTGRGEQGMRLTEEIDESLNRVFEEYNTISAAYLIWKDPYMTVGGDTFIHDMMRICGLKNVFEHTHRYPEVTVEEIKERSPRVLLLSSEPYPFREEQIHTLSAQLPATKVLLADGEMFSWYGSRLLHSGAYFRALRKQFQEGF
jgi:ABC-type Fe3+-hydroxamate transport system substrate-binding protein